MESLPYAGRLLNAVVLLVVTLAAFSLSYNTLKVSDDNNSTKVRYFGYFWLATAFLWLSSTLRNIFAAFDVLYIDFFFFHLTQVFLYISGAYLGPYTAIKMFKNNRLILFITYLYRVIGIVGVFLTLKYGVGIGAIDKFSTEYIPNRSSQILFLVAALPILAASCIDVCVHLYAYTKRRELFYQTLAPLSIVLYLAVGVIDERGFLGSWQLNLFRLVFLVAFFMAWTAVLQESTEKEKQNPQTAFSI